MKTTVAISESNINANAVTEIFDLLISKGCEIEVYRAKTDSVYITGTTSNGNNLEIRFSDHTKRMNGWDAKMEMENSMPEIFENEDVNVMVYDDFGVMMLKREIENAL